MQSIAQESTRGSGQAGSVLAALNNSRVAGSAEPGFNFAAMLDEGASAVEWDVDVTIDSADEAAEARQTVETPGCAEGIEETTDVSDEVAAGVDHDYAVPVLGVVEDHVRHDRGLADAGRTDDVRV